MDNASIDLQRRFYDMLMRSQYWPADRMRDHQRTQLTQLLRHARKNVPFYQTRLDAAFRPDGEIDWDRWSDIPILTRGDLQTRFDAMQASELPTGHGPTMVQSSSGSTGTPVSTTQVLLTNTASDAAMARSHAWHGIDFDRDFLNISGDDPAVGAWPEGKAIGTWGPRFLSGSGQGLKLNLIAEPAQQVEFIQRRRPNYVSSLTTRLRALALEAQRQGEPIAIEAVMTRAEGAPVAARELFRSVFGARTIEMYSSQETARIAHGCPDAIHLHINAELILVEIVDDDGRPCPAGVRGRVILTPFYNTGQPLIRYEIGDIAALGPPCSCGRTLPVLEPVAGRIAHLFTLPDGRRFLPNVGDGDVDRMGIEAWQLAQVSADRAEFRYVAPQGKTLDHDQITRHVHKGLLEELTLTVARVEAFILKPQEKHVSYKNEYRPG